MRNENEMRDPSGMPAREETARGPQLGETESPTSGLPEGGYEEGRGRPMADRSMPEGSRAGGMADGTDYTARFDELQTRFIDDPRDAVSAAESLVEEAVDRLMTDIRSRLDAIRSQSGGDGDTERLRVAMREYRDVLTDVSR